MNINDLRMRKIFKQQLIQKNKLIKLPVVGDGLSAKIAEKNGSKALNVTGFAINTIYGEPDRGFADFYTLWNQARKIIEEVKIPVLCGVGTGHGFADNIARTERSYEAIGATGIYIDDGVWPKECGQMSTSLIAPVKEVQMRIKAAISERKDSNFLIIIHSVARSAFDLDKALNRYSSYLDAGADVLFVDNVSSITELRKISQKLPNTILMVNPTMLKRSIEWNKLLEIGYSLATYNDNVIYQRFITENSAVLQEIESTGMTKEAEEQDIPQDFDKVIDMTSSIRLENKYKIQKS